MPGTSHAASPSPRAPTALVYDDFYTRHLAGVHHIERPQRCGAILKALTERE
ncbi:MAG: hypothetical protein J7M14_06205 [Planctomycetes bacterium]|nr:hypothetical protein [Planctomycetota bacterium]